MLLRPGAMSLLNFPGRPLKAPTLNSRDRPVISTLSDTTREPLLAVLIAPSTFVSCVAASRFTPRMVTIRYRRPDSRYVATHRRPEVSLLINPTADCATLWYKQNFNLHAIYAKADRKFGWAARPEIRD